MVYKHLTAPLLQLNEEVSSLHYLQGYCPKSYSQYNSKHASDQIQLLYAGFGQSDASDAENGSWDRDVRPLIRSQK